jgi:drug/metabolite transporter (DMT)-like permease
MTETYSPPLLKGEGHHAPSPERYWYLVTISGAIGLIVGVIVLSAPNRSLKALAVIVGIYLLVLGVLLFARTFSDEDRGASGMLLGILSLIAGLVVIRHPSQSVVVVSMALGIYFVAAGALNLARAIIGPRRLGPLIAGIVLIAAGVLITSSPDISVKTLALFTGIALCLQGGIQIGESLLLRAAWRAEAP